MKLWSKFFIPTLRETPADAEVASHQLLLRAGLARKVGGGLYTYLPLGLRVLHKISEICRQELDAAGALELCMPHLHPAEFWQRGPRWDAAREIMFRVDHAGAGRRPPTEPELVLGPTHEEIITPLARAELSSYRDLPKNFFQISAKFRNEIRPRYGLMRAREFVMMDSYSFDVDDASASNSYFAMKAAYERFFARVGLAAIAVEADTGVMGGSASHEFMAPAEIGDDDILYCVESGYAANREKARSGLVPGDQEDAAPLGELEPFATPGVVTIAALEAAPYSVPADQQFKTLVLVGDGKPFVVVLRGSDELEQAKLGALGFAQVRPATAAEIEPLMGAKPGSLGAVKHTIRDPGALAGIFADHAIRLIGNGTTGKNEDGMHLRYVNVQRDLAITRFADLRRVRAGEPCPRSGLPLQSRRGIEVGHIFKLGTKYSEKCGALYSDAQKQTHPMVMGCYGIGVSRTLQALIEQCHDADGILWPWQVAPFQVTICVLDPEPQLLELANRLAAVAEGAGAEVLIDDREERPGVKFKDADLVGAPLRVTVGGKGFKEGRIELKWRARKDIARIPLEQAERELLAAVRAQGPA